MVEAEKIRCPYCNLLLNADTKKCPSCGYFLAEVGKTAEAEKKKEDKAKKNVDVWREVEELYRKYTKQEKKIDTDTIRAWETLEEITKKEKKNGLKEEKSERKMQKNKVELRKWNALAEEVRKIRQDQQTVTLPTSRTRVTSMKTVLKTDGLTTKSCDMAKRYHVEKKVHRKLTMVPLLFSLILILSVTAFMFHILTEKKIRIHIDGSFEDWVDVGKFKYQGQHLSVNPNINITSAAIWENEKFVYIYVRVEGNALYGNNVNRTDEFYIFFDTDINVRTGYLINGIGADNLIRITGISNRVLSADIFSYKEEKEYPQDNWNSWDYLGRSDSAVKGAEMEVCVSKSIIPYKNAPVEIVANSFTGDYDEIPYPLISGNAVFLTEIFEMPAILSEREVKVLTAYLKIIGEPEVKSILVDTPSSLIVGSIEYKGSRTLLKFENNMFVARLNQKFSDGDHFAIYADTSSVATGNVLTLSVNSINVENGYFWKKSTGINKKAYVRSVPASQIEIDGAFGDWDNLNSGSDAADTNNPNIDIETIKKYINPANEIFFYINMKGMALAGTFVPQNTPDYTNLGVSADSDRDTIPDASDPLPYDFNNDGIPDAQSHGDVDGDGILDYPYGNDYYLNTTIPDDARFPPDYRGKRISVYIGPFAETGETVLGVDYIRVYVDADTNASTGFPVYGENGAEYLLEIAGRCGRFLDTAIFEWHGKWEKIGTLGVANFGSQMEFGKLKLFNPEKARYFFITTDWRENKDTFELKPVVRAQDSASISSERVFDTNIRINSNTSAWQIWPDMASDAAGTIYAVWEGNETGSYAIYFSKSQDGGITWTQATKIPYSDDGSDPAIAVYGAGSSAIIHIVFTGSALGGGGLYPDLYYARSTDGGNTFTTTILDATYSSTAPDICVDASGYLYVVYTNYFLGFDPDIKLIVSPNNGQSFTSPINIANSGYAESLPAVAVEGAGASSTLHIVYTYQHYNESGNERYDTDVVYRKVSNAGSNPSVGAPVNVSNVENYSEYVIPNSVAVDTHGYIHIVYTWNWSYGNYDVYYARSIDGGNSFTKTNLVDYSLKDEYEPRIAIDDADNPHIVWQDNRSGNYDIWYTNSSDNGATFLPYNSHVKVNKDTTTQPQACATILFVNAPGARKELCVAWADKRSGDYDVYFANGTNLVYLQVNSQYGTPSGTGWYAAGSIAKASVNGLVYESTTVRDVCTGFTGSGSAPSSGTSNSTTFTIYIPSAVNFTWRKQYYCSITFTGTDAQHTVNGSYVENGTLHNIAGLVDSWSGWCDENTLLYFHDVTSPQQNYTTDIHSWTVTAPITAVIHYTAPVSEIQSLFFMIVAFLVILVGFLGRRGALS
ncbi:MAG: hypothetical protein ACP5JR_02735 [Thermoplasmata archaeon]